MEEYPYGRCLRNIVKRPGPDGSYACSGYITESLVQFVVVKHVEPVGSRCIKEVSTVSEEIRVESCSPQTLQGYLPPVEGEYLVLGCDEPILVIPSSLRSRSSEE